MPVSSDRFRTGGALHGAAAASLLRERQRAAELQPGVRVGLYRVLDELGRGGMAIVYRAERADGEYEQRVALKWMLDPQPDAASEALFRRERQALADLRHPHIARLLDGGRSEDGRPWFVMELIEGQRLDQHCESRRLTLPERLQRFREVCSAVAFAHARGVIHRDIKPSNVLVDVEGGAKLLDFGIAQLLGREDATVARAFTPGFASPEQLRGEAPTAVSDVFQLGALLAAILQPRSASRERATVTRMLDETHCGTFTVPSGLPADLAAIIGKATRQDPAQRYATVESLSEDLGAFLAHRPVKARKPTAGYRLERLMRRHPFGVAASAAGIALLLVSSSLFTWQLATERDNATHQAGIANAALQFMREDLLAAADPAAAPGRELTVRDALDMASGKVDARFADAPVERSAIRATLASLYLALGRIEQGEQEARLAIEALGEVAPTGAQAWTATETLARALIEAGRYREAADALDAFEARFAPDPELQLQLDLQRTYLLHGEGHFAESENLAREAIDRAVGLGGAGHSMIQFFNATRADSLLLLGRQAEALQLARDLHTGSAQRYGADNPSTMTEANRVGQILRHMGALDEAEPWFRDLLVRREDVLGAEHHKTVATANELATVLQEAKRYADAEPLFQRVLDTRLKVLGEAHIYTRNSMSNLGLLYSLWNRPEQAAPLLERALHIELAQEGPVHPDTLALMHNIAGLYRRQGRMDDAVVMHERVIEAAAPVLGESAWQLGLFHVGLAQTRQTMRDFVRAEAAFDKAVTILDSSLGSDNPRTLRARELRKALLAERAAAP